MSVDEIRQPCPLKIDTEGYEREVLKGASGLMAASDTVAVEVHFDKPQSYSDMLDHHIRAVRVVRADLVFERSA